MLFTTADAFRDPGATSSAFVPSTETELNLFVCAFWIRAIVDFVVPIVRLP